MFLVLAAAAALAMPPKPTPFSNGRPPARFQANATVTLQMADQAGIDAVCHAAFGKPPANMKTDGCQVGDRIVLPNPCTFADTDRYAAMLCHELGHANGWSSNHQQPQLERAQAEYPADGGARTPKAGD